MPSALSESKKELLGKLLRGGASSARKPPEIPRREAGNEAPISYGQQQIWLHSQFSGQAPIYNEAVTVHYLGAFDRPAFERAFTEIIRRHEAWRTTFRWGARELVQRIQPPPERISIPFLDVSALPGETREQTAIETAREDALAPYDLAVGPLYRPRLVRFSEREHRLFLGLHHIIFDGVSLYGIFMPELQALYEAFSQGGPSPLEEPPLQYADYAVWHRRWVEEIAPRQLAYWRAKLQGSAGRDILPTDHPRTEIQSYRGETEILSLDTIATTGLKDLSQRSGTTLFMTLLATFHVLLWAFTGEEDLIIGCTSAGRNRSETGKMMGFFLNTVALRTDLSDDPTFLDVMRRGREELLSSLDNDGIPFEHLVKALCVERDGSRHPFFQILFAFEPPLAPLPPNWKFTQMDIDIGATKFDLHLELDERHDGIIGRFIYNADLFERETIQRMLRAWRLIVQAAIAEPSRRLSELKPAFTEVRNARPEKPPPVAAASSAPPKSGVAQSMRRWFR